jgi:molybdopterin-guanine dinucleotide biosynthesis protein
MKVVICAGPPTTGKTTVLKQVTRRLKGAGFNVAYLKIDVQYALKMSFSRRNSISP